VADVDPSELVTIRNTDTEQRREVPRGAVPFFVNDEQPWELDTTGPEKTNQPTPKES
jgi:hypothetical protein